MSSSKNRADYIISDSELLSLKDLRVKARKATRNFWCLLVSFVLIASMIVPYFSMAAVVADQTSTVFTGEVFPGYSMGGVQLTAYGVDINSWGTVSKDKFVTTNYGVWSGDRAKNARENAKAVIDKRVQEDRQKSSKSAEEAAQMSTADKFAGWVDITGRFNYSLSQPNGDSGTFGSATMSSYDSAVPYRTVDDCAYWDGRKPTSSDTASANIRVSLFADFVVVALNEEKNKATLLVSPDSLENKDSRLVPSGHQTGGTSTCLGMSGTAIPYYVPLSSIFDAYGVKGEGKPGDGVGDVTITTLLDKIKADGGKQLAATAVKSNLLEGENYTQTYQCLNGSPDKSDQSSTNAFNPYPYSMVFSSNTGNSKIVSSLYENCEAYVYFSPYSVYNQYMALKSEYTELVADSSGGEEENAVKVFRAGYYLAEMAILEAYLEEALPQDMTRGYVGPSESPLVYQGKSDVPGNGENALGTTQAELQRVSYSTLMYDVASSLSVSEYNLGWTNAIMNTLSVFRYGKGNKSSSEIVGKTGVMRGLNAFNVQTKRTSFTAYSADTFSDTAKSEVGVNEVTAGIYTPPYYPIQSHKMPKIERTYRFQILASVPYETVIAYIRGNGFSTNATLSYASKSLEDINTSEQVVDIVKESEKTAALAAAFDTSGDKNDVLALRVNKSKMLSLGAKSTFQDSDFGEGSKAIKNLTKIKENKGADRADKALLGYLSSNMDADNVHDLYDVVRYTNYLKYESWFRFYNPNKSEGTDDAFFLSRISPAATVYFPSVLINGYTAAGGQEIDYDLTTTNCSFDYFSPPSFAPCFASHTSSDCYYGVFNYEERAFFSADFLKSLSANAGIPALERYTAAQEKKEELDQARNSEEKTLWKDIGALYVMAKRLSWIEMCQDIRDYTSYDVSRLAELAGEYDDDDTQKTIAAAQTQGLSKLYVNTENENDWKEPKEVKFGGFDINGDPTVCSPNDDGTDKSGKIWANKEANPFDHSQGNIMLYSTEDHSNGVGSVQASLLATYVYDDKFAYHLGPGGDYYWAPPETIRSKIVQRKYEPAVSDDNGSWVKKSEQFVHGVAFDGGVTFFKSKNAADPDVVNGYKELIAACATEITNAVANMRGDQQTLMNSMPSQMMNCLAWATDQNSTVSISSYQEDPSDANVTVLVNGGGTSEQAANNEPITSIKQIQKYGYTLSKEGTIEEASGNATESETSMKAKMVRGVEGTTAIATTQPSNYSISATVMRISTLNSESGLAFPYSGLCQGRLSSGTNRYAELQAHVIDYTSIENGIAGDLANTTRAKLVKISNPEYTAAPDFLSILNNFAGIFGEMGSSMLKASTGMFNSIFFQTNRTKPANSSSNNSEAAVYVGNMGHSYYVAEQLKYTPAGNYTYDSSKDILVASDNYRTGYPISQGTEPAAQAATFDSAAANSIINGFGGGFYALLQQFGLLLVMVSLLIVAFKNFAAYMAPTTSKRNGNIISAQFHLKTVLPRSVIAVFMIGIPPLNGSVGFQGGAFLLCQFLSELVGYVAQTFMFSTGSGFMSILTISDPASDFPIGGYLIYFLCAIIISIMVLVATACVFLQSLALLVFYFISPIVWAFYAWPYPGDASEPNSRRSGGGARLNPVENALHEITRKLQLGVFTGGKAGNLAPTGWILGYLTMAGINIAWALLIWLISMIFVGTAGSTGSAAAFSADLFGGSATASAGLFEDLGWLGKPGQSTTFGMICNTALCCVVFYLFIRMFITAFKGAAFNSVSALASVGSSVASVIKSKGSEIARNKIEDFAKDIQSRDSSTRTNRNLKRGLAAAEGLSKIAQSGADMVTKAQNSAQLVSIESSFLSHIPLPPFCPCSQPRRHYSIVC